MISPIFSWLTASMKHLGNRFVLQQGCCTESWNLSQNMLKCPVNPVRLLRKLGTGEINNFFPIPTVPIVPCGLLQSMPILYKKVEYRMICLNLSKLFHEHIWENLPTRLFFWHHSQICNLKFWFFTSRLPFKKSDFQKNLEISQLIVNCWFGLVVWDSKGALK